MPDRPVQCRIGARADRARRGRGRAPTPRAGGASGQSRRRRRRTTTRSAPAAARTSSASPSTRRSRSTRWRAGWRGSSWSGCICTSARRSSALRPSRRRIRRGIDLVARSAPPGVPLRRLDLGGGFGVPYAGEAALDLAAYAALIRELTAGLDLELVFEPGRYLVAEAGVVAQPRALCQRGRRTGIAWYWTPA